MKTIIDKINPDEIDEIIIEKAADILKNGGTVAFPTETVYGIGANALDQMAGEKIYKAKGRPSDNPLIVHISSIEMLDSLVCNVDEKAKILMENFWPGPLTLIFNKSEKISKAITANLSTVAIRMPSHPIAMRLIEKANIPVAAPSANTSGKPSPTIASHVIEDLEGRVDMIIDGGRVSIGLESTVLDVSGEIPMILRPGSITLEMIKQKVGQVVFDPAIFNNSTNIVPKSPGMKYKHYSPKAEVIIVKGSIDKTVEKIMELKKEKERKHLKVGIMATEQTKDKYSHNNVISIGNREKPDEIATNLFKTLREFDVLGVDVVYAESVPEQSIGVAIMNRLIKAAGYRIIQA